MVVGCMYTHLNGGSFGQHAWTEIYMGKAGWVSVDSTAHEIDFVDAGHIRLGQEATFMPKKMEILEHRSASAASPAAPETVPERYAPYLGSYSDESGPMERAVFRVLYRNGGLALDIPARMVCELKEPSPEGIWFLKLTDRVGVRFEKDAAGAVTGLSIFENLTLPRKEGEAPGAAGTPDALRPFVGDYKLPMSEAVVRVSAADGVLVLDLPRRGRVTLAGPDARGRWLDARGNGDHFTFVLDTSGRAVSLSAFLGEIVPRGTLAAHRVEGVIREKGLSDGLELYRELRAAPPPDCRFSEQSFNLLGYRLLGQGKTPEAIAIFRLNAEAYPASANVYDSLGEAYLKAGDKAKAKENYAKSLELNPKNENARKAIDSMGE
ncbi:MAG: tetratricopeptide repeat protein [Acidobacteria bacterium]|nr:tetratricopeptide repeat protein [Acidobacteriota bacterium]